MKATPTVIHVLELISQVMACETKLQFTFSFEPFESEKVSYKRKIQYPKTQAYSVGKGEFASIL